jgi:hypothetical protein
LIEALAEELETEDGAKPESVNVDAVGLIIAVDYENEDGEDYSAIRWRCSDGRKWVQYGLFGRVAECLRLEPGE